MPTVVQIQTDELNIPKKVAAHLIGNDTERGEHIYRQMNKLALIYDKECGGAGLISLLVAVVLMLLYRLIQCFLPMIASHLPAFNTLLFFLWTVGAILSGYVARHILMRSHHESRTLYHKWLGDLSRQEGMKTVLLVIKDYDPREHYREYADWALQFAASK